MAEKTMSMAELLALQKEGATLKFPPKPVELQRLGELIDALNQMVSNEEERIRADLARNQTNLEILATLQALIRKQGEGKGAPAIDIDMTPIVQALGDMRATGNGSYSFDIERDGRGFAQRIVATPVGPTRH